MVSTGKFVKSVVLAAGLFAGMATAAQAAAKTDFKVCWSIYAGWMPWGYIQDSGLMKKWADKYNIKVDVVQINDYVESINQYTAGAYDGCAMTNMDALSIPAGGGVDTTALIIGDFSNGNDAVILKNDDKLDAIKGQKVNLVELSVSHYLLARALDSDRAEGSRHHGRQHLRRRHGGGVRHARRHGGGDVEPLGLDDP